MMNTPSPEQLKLLEVTPSDADLQALESAPRSPDHTTTLMDGLKSAGTGLARGVIEAPGMIGDMANMLQLGFGKLGSAVETPGMKRLYDQVGYDPEKQAQNARDYLAGKGAWYNTGSNAIADALTRAGILDYAPQGDAAKTAYNVGHFAGGTLSAGLPGIIGGGLRSGAVQVAKEAAKDLAVGTGAGVGTEAADGLADAAGVPASWKTPMKLAGAVIGGGATGAGLNRTALYQQPPILKLMDDAGIEPHFPSEVNPNPGMVGNFFSKVLPKRYGAQSSSQANAEATQDQLNAYGRRTLNFDSQPGLSEQGRDIQTAASDNIPFIQRETAQAFDNVGKHLDGVDDLSETKRALAGNPADSPRVQALVESPALAPFKDVLSMKDLSWRDMNMLRTKVGEAMETATGTDRDALKTLHDGVTTDMGRATWGDPETTEAFQKALELERQNKIDIEMLRDAGNRTPETVPAWMMDQSGSGATRLNSLLNNTGGDNRTVLNNAARTSDGKFDVDKLMQFWYSRSPDAREALLGGDPGVSQSMENLSDLHSATATSRTIANGPGKDKATIWSDPASALSALGVVGSVGGHIVTGAPSLLSGAATAAAAAEPLAARIAAGIGQSPALIRRMAPREGDMMSGGQTMGLPAVATSELFPDVYRPPTEQQHAELPTGADVQGWLGSTDRASAANFITQRLGPQIGQQLDGVDDQGFKAALFSLSSDPHYRQALAANPLPEDGADAGDIPTMTIRPGGAG